LGTFLPFVGSTKPILCLGIGMKTQHGPVPVLAKTTQWYSCETFVELFLQLGEHRSSQIIIKLLTAQGRVAPCMTSTEQIMIRYQSTAIQKYKAWQRSTFFGDEEEGTSLICQKQYHQFAHNWRPYCSLYELIQTEHDQ